MLAKLLLLLKDAQVLFFTAFAPKILGNKFNNSEVFKVLLLRSQISSKYSHRALRLHRLFCIFSLVSILLGLSIPLSAQGVQPKARYWIGECTTSKAALEITLFSDFRYSLNDEQAVYSVNGGYTEKLNPFRVEFFQGKIRNRRGDIRLSGKTPILECEGMKEPTSLRGRLVQQSLVCRVHGAFKRSLNCPVAKFAMKSEWQNAKKAPESKKPKAAPKAPHVEG
ncbi:MAG: hypothetical protein HRU19_16350 [Pseudobacteriovorax sp.]|nr:hypothetical protein [Pseudobacteriovorax sp.]